MWQRFTERARKAIFYAQEEATNYKESFVAPVHILLGILRQPDSGAAGALSIMGVGLEALRNDVQRSLRPAEENPADDMTLSPGGKRLVDLAYDGARKLECNTISTEILLFGLVRCDDPAVAKAFKKHKMTPAKVEKAVLKVQKERRTAHAPASKSSRPEVPTERLKFAQEARAVRRDAREAADTLGEGNVSTEHLLLALVHSSELTSARILQRLGVTPNMVWEEVERCCATYRGNAWSKKVLPRVQRVLDAAGELAESEGAEVVGTAHLLVGLVREGDGIAAKALARLGVEEANVLEAIRAIRVEGS